MSKTKKMPDIQGLIVRTWERVVENLSGLVKLLLLGWLGYGITVAVASAWLLALGVTNRNIISEAATNPMVLLESGLVLQSSIVLIVLILLFTVLANLIAIVKIRVLTGEGKIIKTAKENFKLVLPLIGLHLLVGLLIMGGTWLFLIPGLIIYFFTIFASLELVLGERGIIEAIKTSALKVKANLVEVLVRVLALAGLMILVWGISAAMIKSESLGGLFLSFLRIFAGWYSTAYIIELYKHLSSPEDKEGTIWWIWVIGVLGWVVLIGLSVFVSGYFFDWFRPIEEDWGKISSNLLSAIR